MPISPLAAVCPSFAGAAGATNIRNGPRPVRAWTNARMKLEAFNLVFPVEYLRAALMVSLLSVWVLVGLFFYLNRFTKRQYFTVWTAAWLFYALWLTLSVDS